VDRNVKKIIVLPNAQSTPIDVLKKGVEVAYQICSPNQIISPIASPTHSPSSPRGYLLVSAIPTISHGLNSH
jgi:hypothetical protein